MTKIIIADDHPIFRSGVRQIIESIKDVTLVGEAEDGAKAYHLILSELPDIAILDLEMPHLTGLDVCKKVLGEKNFTKFIILTMHKEKHYFTEAMNAGVLGYLLKDTASIDLVECIKTVNQDKKYVSPQIEKYLVGLETTNESIEYERINQLLTPTEKVILKLISEGNTSSDIALMLFISTNTIENHRAKISKKLELTGEKNSLLKYAIQQKNLLK
jgi:DNA-binding NarL/FixJ family response regulator